MLVTLTRLIVSSGRKTRSHLIPLLVTINLLFPLFIDVAMAAGGKSGEYMPSTSDDNDFAEFEEFDEEEEAARRQQAVPGQQQQSQTPGSASPQQPGRDQPPVNNVPRKPSSSEEDTESFVEEEVDEEPDEEEVAQTPKAGEKKTPADGELKITSIPAHLRNNWDAYYVEIIMGFGIFVYFINFIAGRSKNESLANAWLETNRNTLESNFALVGDDGKKEIENHGLIKDTENYFYLWCSGRVGMEGMLIEIRLWKRHDLVSVIAKLMKPVTDQITLRFTLNSDAMDNFVFCLAQKKAAIRIVKEYTDISTFCPERKTVEKFGINSDKFFMMNEVGEVPSGILDQKITVAINRFEDLIDYIHISDQYSGPKASDYDPQPLKMPEVKKVAIVCLNMSSLRGRTSVEGIEEAQPLLQMVLYLIDRVRKFRLSKEGKSKSDKNRQKVEETFLKATHAQRQEAAQLKREERRRAEKEKILNEDDPEKQRKWEEREYRREMKKKTPKMKQVKVKAM